MGTSPPKTTGYVSGEDPATVEANRVYQDALARLSQSLDTRKNRFFDPVWLAAAQGFLAPTQTGGFGESLGNVAKNVSAAQAEDIKQEQAINEQRVAAAGKGVELQRMRANDAEFDKYLKRKQLGPIAGPQAPPLAGPGAGGLGATTTDSSAGALPALTADSLFAGGRLKPEELAAFKAGNANLPTGRLSPEELTQFQAVSKADKLTVPEAPMAAKGAGAGQTGALPAPAYVKQAPQGALPVASGFDDDGGVQILPPNPNLMTGDDYIAINRRSGKPFADILKEAAELERKYLEVKESGTTNLITGRFYANKAALVDTQIFGEGYGGKTFKVPESVALQLGVLQRQGNEAGYKALADKFTGRTFGQKPGSPPVTGGSVEDRALAAKQAEALAAASTTQEIEDRKNFVQRGRDADDQITLASQFRKFASDPDAAKMVGILNNDKVSSAVAKAVESGIGSRNYRIGVPEIQDIMRNSGLDPAGQAKYRTFLMLVVNSQLQKTKYLKGSISNYEDRLLASAGINSEDTVETIRIKSDLITRGAQFDRLVAKTFKASKMTADEFLDSDKYSQLRDKYNSDMSELSFGGKTLAPDQAAQRNPSPAAQGAAVPAAGQPSPGYIKDPKTGVVRRKKAGE